jgi:hypothetical protein
MTQGFRLMEVQATGGRPARCPPVARPMAAKKKKDSSPKTVIAFQLSFLFLLRALAANKQFGKV